MGRRGTTRAGPPVGPSQAARGNLSNFSNIAADSPLKPDWSKRTGRRLRLIPGAAHAYHPRQFPVNR